MKSKYRKNLPMLVLCFWFGLSSCKHHSLDIDLSGTPEVPVKIQRFDTEFFSLTANSISEKLPALQKAYPGFTDLFIGNILCRSGLRDSACIPEIIRFVNDKDMKGAFDACQSLFGEAEINGIQSQLSDIFRHHVYYFPHLSHPRVLAMMSGFNYAVVTADSVVAVGLEMYLGEKNKFYEMLQIPAYKRLNMRKEFIPGDVLHAWVALEFPNPGKSGTLLNEMIYQGKLLYLADAMMPRANDTLKIGYTGKQLAWCEEHEQDIWGYLIKNKFLYSMQLDVISKFMGEGPFTTGFVKESPSRTGVWIGWKIVRKYMETHPEISPEELMKEPDAQKILSLSKYKP